MNLLPFLRPIRSAPVALERLHTVLEYDRCLIGQTDLIPVLHTDILAAISRYITVDPDKVQVRIHSLADPAGMRRIGGTDDGVSGTQWRWMAAILVIMSFVVIVGLVVGCGRPGIVATNQGLAHSAATSSTERSASGTSETVPSAPSSAASPPSSAGPSSAPEAESRSAQANPTPSPAGSCSFSNASSLETTESGSSTAASPSLPNTTERGSSTGSSSSSVASSTESNNTAALAQQTTLSLDSEQVAQSLQTQTQPPVTANTQRISPDRLSARQVRQIQQALDNMGFKAGWIDGKWGPKTEAALKSFQRSRNIASNGQLDQTTVAALGLNAADFGLTGSDATNGQTPIDVG